MLASNTNYTDQLVILYGKICLLKICGTTFVLLSFFGQHPKNQALYRMLNLVISINSLGNPTWWGFGPITKLFALNRLCVHVGAPFCFLSQLAYLKIHSHELTFTTVGIILSIAPVNLMVNVILFSSKRKSYKKVMKDFMGKIHLYNYQDDDEFVKMIRIQVERYTRWIWYFLLTFLMTDWLSWITLTCLNNILNKEAILNKTAAFQTVVYLVAPFEYNYDFKNWVIMHLSSVYFAFIGCIMIVIFNTLNYIFIFHFIGHVQILKHRIQTQFSGDVILDNDDIRKKLIELIKYHSFILTTFKEIESAFGLNVASYYLYNMFCDSLSLYQIMYGDKGNLMMYGLMIVVYMGGLILVSFVLEEVRRQSDGLPELVYAIPWEKMSISNQKIVVLILARMQPVLVFKALGGLEAGVRPMMSIIKTIFSYYVMLKSSI